MFKIIIATHGNLADSLKETLGYFAPEDDSVIAFSLASEDIETYRDRVQYALSNLSGEELLVFVDALNGTPFNCFYSALNNIDKPKQLIAGVNFPMLLTAYLNRESQLNESLDEIITSGTVIKARFDIDKICIDGDE